MFENQKMMALAQMQSADWHILMAVAEQGANDSADDIQRDHFVRMHRFAGAMVQISADEEGANSWEEKKRRAAAMG